MSLSGFLVSLAAVLAATLLPWSNFVGHSHWAQVQWIPFYGRRLDWFDIAANVALFAPLGYFGAFLAVLLPGKKQLWVLVGATLLSTSAEFIQIYSHGRFPSATDIGCNIVGAAAWSHDFSPVLARQREIPSVRGQQILAANQRCAN